MPNDMFHGSSFKDRQELYIKMRHVDSLHLHILGFKRQTNCSYEMLHTKLYDW